MLSHSRHFTFRTSCASFESVASTSTMSARMYCRAGSAGCVREAVIVGRKKRQTKKGTASERTWRAIDGAQGRLHRRHLRSSSGFRCSVQTPGQPRGDCSLNLLCFVSILGDRDRDSDRETTHLGRKPKATAFPRSAIVRSAQRAARDATSQVAQSWKWPTKTGGHLNGFVSISILFIFLQSRKIQSPKFANLALFVRFLPLA